MSEDDDGTDDVADESDDAADGSDDGTADGATGDPTGAESRHDRLQRHPTPGAGNSLRRWTDAKPVWRVALNYVLVWIARVVPSLRLRNWALRRLGVTVGEGVSWGLEATPDVFWPELITLGDHAVVGYDSVILCHEFLQDEYRTGEVVVGERAMIGAKAVVLPGVRIGEGAQVAANSLVTRDVPPETTVAGVPARPVDRDGAGDADADESGAEGESGTEDKSGDEGENEDKSGDDAGQ